MEPASHEIPPLASVEAIKAFLAGLIASAAHDVGGKVQLTYLGGEFAKAAGTTFEKHLTRLATDGIESVPFTKRKMAPFMQAYCHDLIIVDQLSTGAFVAHLKESSEGGPQLASAPEIPAALKFKRPVWAAFIRPLAHGKRFLNLDQIGFTDADTPPTEGRWKEIGPEFILGAAPDEHIDGRELQERIEKWARGADIPISALVMSPSRPAPPARSLNALLDLIDSLPAQIAAEWSIPASVLRHLRHSR